MKITTMLALIVIAYCLTNIRLTVVLKESKVIAKEGD